MLEGRALACVRDGRTLFENLDCRVKRGEVLRLEGANGAGKTSLLRILCGLALPRRGVVRWNGEDIRHRRGEYHEQLLYIGHCPGIKEELTPLENLRFLRSLGGHAGDREVQEAALHIIGLCGYEDVPVRVLSAGQRRRVALARLWLSGASLWILDEPFTAIDREGIRHLEARLADHVKRGGMLVITSHQSSRLEGCHVRRLGL